MKKIFLIIFILYTTISVKAQVGLRISHVKPSGLYGFVFKGAPAIECTYVVFDPDELYEYGVSIGYYSLHARLDTFKGVATVSGGIGNGLIPSYESYEKYMVIPIGMSFQYRFLENQFHPVAGADLLAELIADL